MKTRLGWLLIVVALVCGYGAIGQEDTTRSPNFQSDCIEHFVANVEVLMTKTLDVNQDGDPDQVAVVADVNDIRLLVLTNLSSENCALILNDRLYSKLTTIQQKIDIREIEAIQLIDGQPALHIWLEKSGLGSGPYRDVTFHAIYTSGNDQWKQIFMIEQCLAYSSLELRETPNNVKQIYLDEDNRCRAPFSSQRDYYIFQWNGESFDLIEEGTVDRWTAYSPILYVCCMLPVIGGVIVGIALMVIVSRRSRGKHVVPS